MASAVTSGNRFSVIFQDEEPQFDFADTISVVPISSKKIKNAPAAKKVELTGSSLAKVETLLKQKEAEKKRLEEEAAVKKAAVLAAAIQKKVDGKRWRI
jgi:hypothetical protein